MRWVLVVTDDDHRTIQVATATALRTAAVAFQSGAAGALLYRVCEPAPGGNRDTHCQAVAVGGVAHKDHFIGTDFHALAAVAI
jgi:hypothetical protein